MNFYFGGRYQGRVISDGGATGAKLVMGRKRSTGEAVAIKIWRLGAPEGIRECRLWERAGSEYFKEAGPDGERLLLVRRWIGGEDLAETVAKNGVFDARGTLDLLIKIAARLRWFYENLGVCFGDLKPENIIYDGENVFLIDFESCEEKASETFPGGRRTLRLLTVGFSAPELAAGSPVQASDFYSLAMTGVFLLSGRADAGSYKCADPGLAAFIARNLSASPEDRCADVDEIEEALRRVRAGLPPFDFRGRTGPESGDIGAGIAGRDISVENMNVKASKIIFSGLRDREGNADREAADGTVPEDTRGHRENHPENDADSGADTSMDGGAYPSGDRGADTSGDRGAETDAAGAGTGNRGREYLPDDGFPEDRGIPFPHVEKGYRRLVIYVPGNMMLASELSYVLAACFGFRTLLCEFTDCTESRVKYYCGREELPSGGLDGSGDSAETARNTARTGKDADAVTGAIASEESPLYGANETGEGCDGGFRCDGVFGSRIRIFRGSLNRGLHVGTVRVRPGAECSDGEMSEFVSSAYSAFDMTVVCDGTLESPEIRDRFLRFCDYIVVPVDGDADDIEREKDHYMWLLRSARISAGKLKIVGWEYEEKMDSDVKLLSESDGRARHLGNISFDSRRHRNKNHTGEFYCEHMPGRIVREYVTVAGILTYGEDVCA